MKWSCGQVVDLVVMAVWLLEAAHWEHEHFGASVA